MDPIPTKPIQHPGHVLGVGQLPTMDRQKQIPGTDGSTIPHPRVRLFPPWPVSSRKKESKTA